MPCRIVRDAIRLSITAMLIISLGVLSKFAIALSVPVQSPNNKSNFPSSTPLVGTFYYGWYRVQNDFFQGWDIGNHYPPRTWASNYLPDVGYVPNVFDPTHNLYKSNDPYILVKQLGWMKQAGIQFGISSWWGIQSDTDKTFSNIINNIMPSTSNPYPAFKWALVYDLEGYGDPTVDQLVNDLNYIKTMYASSPYYLKIDGRPVIFVYNLVEPGSTALNDLARWSSVRQLTDFYVVMKIDPLLAGADPRSMDGWYEYNPGKRFEQDQGFSAFVSPGFWKYDQPPLLARNVTDFEIAVQKLAAAPVHFKLIETWNEWFEGTGVEPAMQIIHDDANGFRPATPSYGNVYINILGKYFHGR